jgi:ubiquinone/menaquinone biosynthesis C-methylase UbiE
MLGILAGTALLFAAKPLAPPRESEIDHLIQILELHDSSSVADVGAGSGEVSIALAKRLGPAGKVYATEINRQLLDRIRNAARSAKTLNIEVLAATQHDTGLPHDCCDGIFLREVYHHLTDPMSVDRSLYKALRPSGRLAVIDFGPVPGWPAPPGVPADRRWHGVPQSVVSKELTTCGFTWVETINWPISATVKNYCLVFEKRRQISPRFPGNGHEGLSSLPKNPSRVTHRPDTATRDLLLPDHVSGDHEVRSAHTSESPS